MRMASCKDCDRRIVCRYYTQWANIEQVETDKCQYFKNKIDMQEVKKGYWEEVQDGVIRCSKCHCAPVLDFFERQVLSKFCPNCGAKLDGDDWIIK